MVDFRLLSEALGGCRTRWVGGRWKSQNRKNVYLSPYVEEPLNLKVIKSFEPEQRSRKCFSCFEILCSMYICHEHPMYISRIHVYGYGTGVVAFEKGAFWSPSTKGRQLYLLYLFLL